MTMNLVFDSVAPPARRQGVPPLAAPRTAIARAMRDVEPHVDEARAARPAATPPGRVDDLLFAVASAVLVLAVALPAAL